MTTRRSFYIDGESSGDYGIWITGSAVYNAPGRDYTFETVPGRSGDLILDGDRFENIRITYPAFVPDVSLIQAARNWLAAKVGYCEIRDDYNPGEYRLGTYVDGLEVTPFNNKYGNFEISFYAKPFRFLDAGQESQSFLPLYSDGSPSYYYTPELTISNTLFDTGETYLVHKNTTAGDMFSDLYAINYSLSDSGAYSSVNHATLIGYATFSNGNGYIRLNDLGIGSATLTYIALVFDGEPGEYEVQNQSDPDAEVVTTRIMSSATVNNPTLFESDPLITLETYETGGNDPLVPEITINGITIATTSAFEGELFVDCDIEDAYLIDAGGTRTNGNAYLDLTEGGTPTTDFPHLEPGTNTIGLITSTTISGGSRLGECRVTIVPRYYRL